MRMGASPTVAPQLDWGKPAPVSTRPRQALGAVRRRVAIIAALILCDVGAMLLGVALVALLAPPPGWHLSEQILQLGPAIVLLHACIGLYGCWGPCPIERLRLRALAALGLGAAIIFLSSAWNSPSEMATIALAALLLFIAGHYLEAVARHALMRGGVWGAPTVLIGSPSRCFQMARTLLADPKLGLQPVGIVTDFAGDEPAGAPLPILCGLADAHRLADYAEVAIIAAADLSEAEGTDAIRLSRLPFAHVIVAENTGGIPNVGMRTRNLGNALGLEIRFDLFRTGNLAFKRLIDLAVALPIAILVLPLVAVLALAVKIVDPGPAFYSQRRVGRDGRALHVLKLRTMYRNAEERLQEHLRDNPAAQAEWARFFKLSADPRVLPLIGNFLRRSSLDELPQLWNVLRGEMSLVGPRPFPDYHMNSFDAGFQALRVSVPPGLTGLWQVSSRSGGDLDVQREQDLFYIRNWSIWLDLYIVVETFPAVFSARGAK